MFEETSRAYHQRGEFVVRDVISGGVPRSLSYTWPDGFVLVKVSEVKGPSPRCFIMIAGGGAVGARPEPKLFHHLVVKGQDFMYGNPFAIAGTGGTVTFGHRMIVPSDIIGSENIRDCIGYLYEMIDAIGQTARAVAEEIMPAVGGRLLDGSAGREDDLILISAQML